MSPTLRTSTTTSSALSASTAPRTASSSSTRRTSTSSAIMKSSEYFAEAVVFKSVIINRMQSLPVDEVNMLLWIKKTWPLCNCKLLQDRGDLSLTAPEPGFLDVIPVLECTELDSNLLYSAKDLRWAALYGTMEAEVLIHRVERELLVIAIPRRNTFVFNFFQSVMEVAALGSSRDPTDRCHDEDMPNMLLQVEYEESACQVIGDAIMVEVLVIDLLEVNEVVLCARSGNIEQSTLFTELYFQKHELASTMLHADSTS